MTDLEIARLDVQRWQRTVAEWLERREIAHGDLVRAQVHGGRTLENVARAVENIELTIRKYQRELQGAQQRLARLGVKRSPKEKAPVDGGASLIS